MTANLRSQRRSTRSLRRQSGVALFISLVLLLVLTIIGVSAVQSTSLEVRMVRNDHDTLLAFQAAESALRDAETQLEGVLDLGAFDDAGTNGLWTIADLDETPRWEVAAIWNDTRSVVAASAVDEVAAPPRYIIERAAQVVREENAYQLDSPYPGSGSEQIEVFRVTALGTGGTVNAQVLLQSTYGLIVN